MDGIKKPQNINHNKNPNKLKLKSAKQLSSNHDFFECFEHELWSRSKITPKLKCNT